MRLGLGLGANRARRVAQWLPTSLGSKLRWWIDPTDPGTVAVSGRIVSVPDASGNGAAATQGTALSRPLLVSETVQGATRNFARVDGSTVYLAVGTASSTDRLVNGTGRVYLVSRVAAGATSGGYIATSQSNSGVNAGAGISAQPNSSGRRFSVGNGTAAVREVDNTAGNTPGAILCHRMQYESGTVTLYRNGASVASGAQSASPVAGALYPFALGAGALGAFGAGAASGFVDIFCAIHTDALTGAEESALSAYLLATFGVNG